MSKDLKKNYELWNILRQKYPKFRNHTAEGTADLFTSRGFEALTQNDSAAIQEFYGLSLKTFLLGLINSKAKNPLTEKGFGEAFDQPWGGIIQKMAIGQIKPISPQWKNLVDGNTYSPFVVRKGNVEEYLFNQNFDYQSLIFMPDDFVMKQVFVADYGMEEYMTKMMEGLQNGYTVQEYVNMLECLNAAINSSKTPLQDSQVVEVSLSSTPTDNELKDFILAVKNTVGAMDMAPQTNAFNAAKFMNTQDKGRLKLLVRQGIKNDISVKTLAGAFNPEELSMGVDIIEVANFGGLIPYADAAFTTLLYPVYSDLGEEIGYATSDNQTTPTHGEGGDLYPVYWKDPNAEVYAVLADKGVIFTCKQNGYTVESIRNPRIRGEHYWVSSPNNTVAYDAHYNLVIFKQIHEIKIDENISHGTVTTTPSGKAVAGTEVTITSTAASGYTLATETVTDANGNSVTITNHKFTMPASDVTVSATFTS